MKLFAEKEDRRLKGYTPKTRRVRAEDSNRRNEALYRHYTKARQMGLDAASSESFAFLQSALEGIDPEVISPLSAVTAKRDVPIKVGGSYAGFPQYLSAFARDVASTGTQYFGLQGTSNTDIPEVQTNIRKAVWRTYDWQAVMTVSFLDMKRMDFSNSTGTQPPVALQELLEESAGEMWPKAVDYVAYAGFLGDPGLIQNPNVGEFTVPNGASGFPQWAKKTPQEILEDINTAQTYQLQAAVYAEERGMANRLLIPYSQYTALTLPMTIGSVGYDSTITYIKKNCLAAQRGVDFDIVPLPSDWISGKGSGGTDRGVLYKTDEKFLQLPIPQPMMRGMTVPSIKSRGGSFDTLFVGCIGQLQMRATQTMAYMDGI